LKGEVFVTQPTFILVHGAWGGAWCWEKLTHDLDARGATWRTLELPSSQVGSDPLTDLGDDAEVVVEVANDEHSPVFLVGHSYAGSVITEAAPFVAELKGLFYIAATVPEIGQSHSDTARLVKVRTEMDAAIHLNGLMLTLDLELAGPALYQDCTPELRDWATSQLSVQTLASFRGVRTSPEVDVPSRYVLCRQDHALDPSMQELVSHRCDEVIEIDSDHSPFLSHSEQLADILVS
jgi:pimeloyl-ACP methyl ester carboxylesterase